MQKKDNEGNEYVNMAIVANDEGVPFFGLKRINKNNYSEMKDDEMESISVLGTLIWDASQNIRDDSKKSKQIDNQINFLRIFLNNTKLIPKSFSISRRIMISSLSKLFVMSSESVYTNKNDMKNTISVKNAVLWV